MADLADIAQLGLPTILAVAVVKAIDLGMSAVRKKNGNGHSAVTVSGDGGIHVEPRVTSGGTDYHVTIDPVWVDQRNQIHDRNNAKNVDSLMTGVMEKLIDRLEENMKAMRGPRK